MALLGRRCSALLANTTLSRCIHAPVDGPMKVLFCSQSFPWAMRLVQQQLEQHPDIICRACEASEVEREIVDADMVLPFMVRLDEATLAKGEKLRCVLQYGVGLEGVDIPACTDRGVYVSNIPSQDCGNAEATAEHAVYLMLAALRQPQEAQRIFEAGQMGEPLVKQVFGRHVLILGFGNVGSKLFERVLPFAPSQITAIKSSPWQRDTAAYAEKQAADANVKLALGTADTDLKRLSGVDIVLIVCPLTNDTRGMVDAAFIDKVTNSNAVVINVARGHVVDRDAIIAALDSNQLSFFASDVGCAHADAPLAPPEPFSASDAMATHERTLFTPHNGGVADVSYRNMARITAETALRVKAGGAPRVWVNGNGKGSFRTE
jgi:phosphoglycerate dehydrogenase-like enzyme